METDDYVQVVVFDSTDLEFFMAHLDPFGRRRSTTRRAAVWRRVKRGRKRRRLQLQHPAAGSTS
jgi:hypothetical protein